MAGARDRRALPRAVIRSLANAPSWLQRGVFERLSKADQRALAWSWAAFEREGQKVPDGNWLVWLLQAGRGFGKTRVGAEWVLAEARSNPGARIALVGASMEEARRVMIEGESGLLACSPPGEEPVWHSSRGELRFASGALATLYSGAQGDGLRGPQHHFAWADELGKWRDARNSWDNLLLGLRLGTRPRAVVTTTPGNEGLLKEIAALPTTAVTRGRTADNLDLPEEWRRQMEALYRGSRIGARELDGELSGEADGALWTRDGIERARLAPGAWGQPVRVVVGVDPPATSTGDACGILVCGRVADGRLLVLADASCSGLSPAGWARQVALVAEAWGADRVVAEVNNGGDMVEEVLTGAAFHLPVRKVRATRGKVARAEPAAVLFETGRAGLAGRFPELEDELCRMTAEGYAGKGSPDRADAMVWALAELAGPEAAVPRVTGL